jgi:hypothetical protein
VSGTLITEAPALITSSMIRQRKASSLRDPSSGENSTSATFDRAYFTPRMAISTTSSGFFRSLYSMWMGEVAMKVWMRGCSAWPMDSAAASMSFSTVRASAAMAVPFTCFAIRRHASNCWGDETGNPASITSTPSRPSCRATSHFCSTLMEAPGDCSPSRRVVSNTKMRSITNLPFPAARPGRDGAVSSHARG